MYSVILSCALALLLGFSGTFLDWWGWGWAILFSLVLALVVWAIVARRIAAKLQPAMARVQAQMEAGHIDAAMQSLEALLPMGKWMPMLRGQLLANMGMIAMTRTLAVELAPKQITVNCIAPGIIVTDMLKETMHISDEQAHAVFDKAIPLGRTGTPEDCAAAAVFFASPAARWITGQFIDVAGGQPT